MGQARSAEEKLANFVGQLEQDLLDGPRADRWPAKDVAEFVRLTEKKAKAALKKAEDERDVLVGIYMDAFHLVRLLEGLVRNSTMTVEALGRARAFIAEPGHLSPCRRHFLEVERELAALVADYDWRWMDTRIRDKVAEYKAAKERI